MENELETLLLALTELTAALSEETASLMEDKADHLQGRPYVAEQREKARSIRARGQQVLGQLERVRRGRS